MVFQLFITKVDQAFHVKCFFEEANHGLSAKFGVRYILEYSKKKSL